MAVARQFLIKDVVTARNINAAIEELLEAMFSVNSVETTKSSIQVSQQSVLRWPPACEDMRLEAEERPLLEDFTKQSIGDWLGTLVCVWQGSVKCSHELCGKVPNKSDY